MPEFSRKVIFPILILWLFFAFRRLYKSKLKIRAFVYLIACIVSIIIAAISALPAVAIFWLHSVGTLFMHFSVFFAYMFVTELMGQDYPLINRDLYILVIASSIVFTADFFRRDEIIPIIDNSPYTRGIPFFIGESVHYAIMVYFNIKTLLLQKLLYARSRNYSYRIIILLNFLANSIALVMFSSALINTITDQIFPDSYRYDINLIYHTLKPFLILFLFFGFSTSHEFVERFTRPLEEYRARSLRQKSLRLEYLRDVLWLRVPPSIVIPLPENTVSRISRLIIDISDARDILWSNRKNDINDVSPIDEARYILSYSANDALEIGTLAPPLPRKGSLERHLEKVAVSIMKVQDTSYEYTRSTAKTARR